MSDSLRQYSYFKTGGTCTTLFVPATEEQARESMEAIHVNKQRHFILGGGTNSLVSDEPWGGAVMVISKLTEMQAQGPLIRVGAGVENTDFAKFALSLGLAGAEFMNRLPGKIGGTANMDLERKYST